MAKKNEIPDFRKMAEELLKELPQQVAEKARAHFLMSFIKEGFTDVSFIPWPKRKDLEGHKILSQSLALRSSIRIVRADLKLIHIIAGEGIPYAAIHNTGGIITVPVTDKMRKYFWYLYKKTDDAYWKNAALTKKTEFQIRIPKRQYIGDSYALMQEIDRTAVQKIIQIQKNLKF